MIHWKASGCVSQADRSLSKKIWAGVCASPDCSRFHPSMRLVIVVFLLPFFLSATVLTLTRIVGMRIVRPVHVLSAALGPTVFLRPIFGSPILVTAVVRLPIFLHSIIGTTIFRSRIGFRASAAIILLSGRWSLHVSTPVIRSWDLAVHAPVVFPVHAAIIAILTTAIFGAIFRRTIHRSTLSRRNHVTPMKIRWPRSGCDRRASVIVRCPKLAVLFRRILVMRLHFRWLNVALALRDRLLVSWPHVYAAATAIEANSIFPHVIDGLVVNVNVGDRHIIYAAVVIERAATPVTARVTGAEISISVIDPAVEPNMWSPITGMPSVESTAPPPIPWGPKEARLRRKHPCTRYPVIPAGSIAPITGGPNVAVARTGWLRINRQCRRTKPHGHKNARERRSRNRQQNERE